METTGITGSCNRKQFTVTNGNCGWGEGLSEIFCSYLEIAPETLLRKKLVEQTW